MSDDIIFISAINLKNVKKKAEGINKSIIDLEQFVERERERSMEKKKVSISKEKKFDKGNVSITLDHFRKRFDDIKLISGKNIPLFESVIQLLMCESKIAFDTEHYKEPSNKLRTSTLQISTPEKMYIFDMVSFLELEDWEKYIKKLDFIFKSEQILKLAYEPVQDFKILNYSTKYKYFATANRIIDLAEIKNLYLEKSYNTKIKGLKGLVQMVFGKSLDKVEQTSDWLQRPLKINQLEYAALDSFILFKLYLKLNLIYTNKFYDLTKVYQLNMAYPSCRTNVVQSRFTMKEDLLILIDEK